MALDRGMERERGWEAGKRDRKWKREMYRPRQKDGEGRRGKGRLRVRQRTGRMHKQQGAGGVLRGTGKG